MSRRKGTGRPTLSPGAVCLVLGGYGCRPAESTALGFEAGTVDLCVEGDTAFAAAWTEHEAFLRQEAQRRGIAPEFGPKGDQFFAEARAIALANGARIVAGSVWPSPEAEGETYLRPPPTVDR